MSPEKWKQIKPFLIEALELDAEQRTEFLEARVLEPDLRDEIQELLRCDEGARALMNISAVEFAGDLLANDDITSPMVGKLIGPYRVEGELGVGGMGAVYLASRIDGKFERSVAIKMLKREFNSKKLRRRFEVERVIQAKLLHPNIATLLDAGSTEDGIPYLVMEYIEGEPIDTFCRSRSLTLNDRLKLFNKACDAVGFAHRNLIVHRDLKPSNILVTADGEPKLLDFGISKLLDAVEEDDHTLTNLGALTPQYASPEQIRGETVTTATDIYSLGVILFKLLTGTYPFQFDGKRNGSVFREITESEPLTPSEACGRGGPKAELPISAAQLRGDLDRIVIKSIRKEPEERYDTVEQLSSDISRFIEGRPVLARPATLSYRAQKFFARNKLVVAAGSIVFLSLLAGIGIAVSQANAAQTQARIASDARLLAEIENEKAKAEQERAEKISRFMVKIVSYANPAWYAEGAKFGPDARVIDALNDLGEKIDVEFAGQPDIQSELHHKFTEVYNFNTIGGRPDLALARKKFHAARALELRRQFYGEKHELIAKDMFYLHTTLDPNDPGQADLLANAIQMMRETNPKNLNLPYMLQEYAAFVMAPGHEKLHDLYFGSAMIRQNAANKYELGEGLLLEALPLFYEHYKEFNFAIFCDNCMLAFAQIKQGKLAEAEPNIQICRGWQTSLHESLREAAKKNLDMVETALARANH